MLSRLVMFALITTVCLASGGTRNSEEDEFILHWYRTHPSHKRLAAQKTPHEWESGAVWHFATTPLFGHSQPPNITVRVTKDATQSCSQDVEWKNVWRKLDLIDPKIPLTPPLSRFGPPIYQVEGRALRIEVNGEVCDAYDSIDGVLTNGEFRGIRIASGLGAPTEVIGTVRGSFMQP